MTQSPHGDSPAPGVAPAVRRRWWTAAALWLALIYSTLYIARPITEWLRGRNLLRLAVTAAFLLAVAAIAAWARRRRLDGRGALVVAGATALGVLAAWQLELPEERLHFIEYGVFAALAGGALAGHRWRTPWTIALTAAAGLGDELIQGALPNRYFGWRDVAVNAAAGALVALTAAALARVSPAAGAGRTPGVGPRLP